MIFVDYTSNTEHDNDVIAANSNAQSTTTKTLSNHEQEHTNSIVSEYECV